MRWLLLEYKTLRGFGRAEVVIQKSRFTASAAPAASEEEALRFIEGVRKEFYNADHNAYAYLIGEHEEIQRHSDDGEPSGTAGRPILEVVRKEGLRYAVVTVTRYFGGVKLGAPGLTRAYGKAAALGLGAAGICTKALHVEIRVILDYRWLGKLENYLAKERICIREADYAEVVRLSVMVPYYQEEAFRREVLEFTSGSAVVSVHGYQYLELPGCG